jgi:putative SOS response-associated peptidase YedK
MTALRAPLTAPKDGQRSKLGKTIAMLGSDVDGDVSAAARAIVRMLKAEGCDIHDLGEHELFGFLTTEPNTVVAPIHPKAMPVILTTPEEVGLWLGGETPDALKLQRPCPMRFCRSLPGARKRIRRRRLG